MASSARTPAARPIRGSARGRGPPPSLRWVAVDRIEEPAPAYGLADPQAQRNAPTPILAILTPRWSALLHAEPRRPDANPGAYLRCLLARLAASRPLPGPFSSAASRSGEWSAGGGRRRSVDRRSWTLGFRVAVLRGSLRYERRSWGSWIRYLGRKASRKAVMAAILAEGPNFWPPAPFSPLCSENARLWLVFGGNSSDGPRPPSGPPEYPSVSAWLEMVAFVIVGGRGVRVNGDLGAWSGAPGCTGFEQAAWVLLLVLCSAVVRSWKNRLGRFGGVRVSRPSRPEVRVARPWVVRSLRLGIRGPRLFLPIRRRVRPLC